MSETRTIVVDYDLPHAPALVWRALTEPKLLEDWLMPNDIAPVVGHKFNFKTRPQGDFDGVVHCEILVVEPQKRLSYSWRGAGAVKPGQGNSLDTVVTWTLEPGGQGTHLHLEHSGFRSVEDKFAYEGIGGGWRGHLMQNLARALAGH